MNKRKSPVLWQTVKIKNADTGAIEKGHIVAINFIEGKMLYDVHIKNVNKDTHSVSTKRLCNISYSEICP